MAGKQTNGTVKLVLGAIAALFTLLALVQAMLYRVAAPSEMGYAILALIFWGAIAAWLLISGINTRKAFYSGEPSGQPTKPGHE